MQKFYSSIVAMFSLVGLLLTAVPGQATTLNAVYSPDAQIVYDEAGDGN